MNEPPPPITAKVVATEPAERGVPLAEIFSPFSFRWAIYDRPTRTIFFGGPDVKTHMTVAERSRVLCQPASYYSPGPGAQCFGGFICRSRDGAFYYDPFSGTFPGMNSAVPEAAAALREYCAAHGLPWKPYDPTTREFD